MIGIGSSSTGKGIIVAGGYNIDPDEVDGVLPAHPAVLEAATIGVPDGGRGKTVKSFSVRSFTTSRARCARCDSMVAVAGARAVETDERIALNTWDRL